MAIRTTSNGICTISLPFKLNITTIVNSRAINVMGDMNGINLVLNHALPFNLISPYLLVMPAAKGIPK